MKEVLGKKDQPARGMDKLRRILRVHRVEATIGECIQGDCEMVRM